jgi:hypothetical protein
MITIERLDIRFDIEGNEEEAVFAKLFRKYIERYDRLKCEELDRNRRMEHERALGDRSAEEKY